MSERTIEIWQTSKSGKKLDRIFAGPANGRSAGVVVDIDPAKKLQPFFGIGGAMTDATNYNLSLMRPEQREQVLHDIFHPTEGMGWNFVRVCIGASDFSARRYSLDDTPGDAELKHFNIDHDLKYNIPTLKRAKEINPDIFFFAAPWSPPAWMKDVGTMVGPGGKLLRHYYPAFARYLALFCKAFAAEGIDIGAISVQNEVQGNHYSKPMPQCLYEPEEEAELIVDHLVPQLKASKVSPKIWIMDHNWNMADYAIRCLEHKGCKSAVDGIAWHPYEGSPENVPYVAAKYPGLHNYYTEGNTSSGWQDYTAQEHAALDRVFRTGHESFASWVAVLDQMGGPGEGPFIVNKDSDQHGMINYNTVSGKLTYHTEHYKIGHIGRFVRRGATRVFSSNDIPNVAFQNPDGSVVVYINHNKKYGDAMTVELPGGRRHSLELEPHSYYTVCVNSM